jgi:myo-inositol-1(or 4)-monophosphatase
MTTSLRSNPSLRTKLLSSSFTKRIASLIKKIGNDLERSRSRKSFISYKDKGGERWIDPVTPYDLKIHRLLKKELPKIFPCPVVSEEGEEKEKQDQPFYWLIDPLDGTNNFINRIPFYTISVALMEGKNPIVGIIYAPDHKELYYAWEGGGSYRNGKKIQVSNRPPSHWIIELATKPQEIHEILFLTPLLTTTRAFRFFGALSYSLAYTAEGKIDLFLGTGYPWDVCAGGLILKEAGGVLLTFRGTPRDFFQYEWSLGGSPEVVQTALALLHSERKKEEKNKQE